MSTPIGTNAGINPVLLNTISHVNTSPADKANQEERPSTQAAKSSAGIKSREAGLDPRLTQSVLTDVTPEGEDNSDALDDLVRKPLAERASKHTSAMGEVVFVLAQARTNTAEANQNAMSQILANIQKQHEAMKAVSKQYQEALNDIQKQVDALKSEYTDAGDSLATAVDTLNKKEEQLAQMKAEYETLLGGGALETDPDMVALKNSLVVMEGEVESARLSRNEAEALLVAKTEELSTKMTAWEAEIDKYKQVSGTANGAIIANHDSIKAEQEKFKLTIGVILELMATFADIIKKGAIDSVKAELQKLKAQQKEVEKNMMAAAQEAAEKAEKARKASKLSNLFAKIAGYLMVGVGVLTAVVGGTGIALAAAGVALLAADEITEAVTGKSLTARVMDPFMQHVFMPMMKQMQKLIDLFMEYTPLGALMKLAGKEAYDVFKQVTAAVATMAAVVAVAMLAKSAGSQLLSKIKPMIPTQAIMNALGTAMQQAVKMVPQAMKNLGAQTKAVLKDISKMIDDFVARMKLNFSGVTPGMSDEAALEAAEYAAKRNMHIVNTAMTVGGVAGAATSVAGNLTSAKANREAEENKADQKVLSEMLNFISNLMKELMKYLTDQDKKQSDIIDSILQTTNKSAKVTAMIYQNNRV